MRHRPTRLFSPKNLAVVLAMLGAQVAAGLRAEVVDDLYQSSVPASGRAAAQQRQAMTDALREVATKVSGHYDLKESQLAIVLKDADKLVQTFAFTGNGKTEPLRLQASFDAAGVNAALQRAGLPVWGSNRPKVLVWLAREDNGQRRFATPEQDADMVAQVKSLSQKRGLPFSWPANDAQDNEILSASDVWGGFTDNIRQASQRYHPDIIVVAKVYKAGLLAQGDWQIIAVGGSHTQGFTGPDAASVVEPGVQWVTQDIAGAYATGVPGGNAAAAATGGPMTFQVSGIRNLQDYAALFAYLKQLVVIKSVMTQQVSGETLTLAVTSDAQIETLLQTLKADGRLLEQPVAPIAAAQTPVAQPVSDSSPSEVSTASASTATPPTATPPTASATPAVAPDTAHVFVWHG